MKNSEIALTLDKFNEALKLGAFPTTCVKNITVLKKALETFKKESDALTKSFSILKSEGETEDKNVYESYLYLSFDNGRSIVPFFENEERVAVEYSEEKVKELNEKQKDEPQKVLFLGYTVSPSRFEEYVKSYNELANSETTEEVKKFVISDEQMSKAENDDKITGELVLFFNENQYYIFE